MYMTYLEEGMLASNNAGQMELKFTNKSKFALTIIFMPQNSKPSSAIS